MATLSEYFEWVHRYPDEPPLYECKACRAVVIDRNGHIAWHDRLDEMRVSICYNPRSPTRQGPD